MKDHLILPIYLGIDASTSYNLTQAELLGRKQVAQVVKLLQDEIPGFENSILLETAVQVGVRETRGQLVIML